MLSTYWLLLKLSQTAMFGSPIGLRPIGPVSSVGIFVNKNVFLTGLPSSIKVTFGENLVHSVRNIL